MFPNEHRRIPRFPFHSKGELRLNFMAHRGTLLDISLFGALFESGLSQIEVAAGDNCVLKILSLSDATLFSVEGVVAHARQNMIGIEFDTPDERRITTLQEIGMLNLATPKLIDRSLSVLLQAWRE
jgi:hypothetical protein